MVGGSGLPMSCGAIGDAVALQKVVEHPTLPSFLALLEAIAYYLVVAAECLMERTKDEDFGVAEGSAVMHL